MPRCSKSRIAVTLVILASFLMATEAGAADSAYPVAGVNPEARPAGAPTQTALGKTSSWYKHAVTGVDEPYPASLQFLESQGRWYTPFTRPGMPGLYDIRGWHTNKK